MDTLIHILLGIVMFYTYRALAIRNRMLKSLRAVYKYEMYRIENGMPHNSNYFDIMLYSFIEDVFLRPLRFGKYDSVKNDYKELLIPFFEE